MRKSLLALAFLVMAFFTYPLELHAAVRKGSKVVVLVRDKASGSAVAGATAIVRPYSIWGISDGKGTVTLENVPDGQCEIEVSMLGYVTATRKVTLPRPADEMTAEERKASSGGDHATWIKITLEEMSLAIDDVVVVAQANRTGESTASKIGRQAIDHLQATSLKDLLQLIPGQIVSSNPSLTSQDFFTNRTLDKYDSNNAFGASVMIDGVPVSNNSNMNSRGGTYSTTNSGVDMRSIGTDDIESVEIIRGIPSAEYGDVSSGTMIINSKVGVTDLKLKAKIFPGVSQFYAGKGMKLGKGGTLNVNLDFADGKSDPRYRNDVYDRLNFSAIHNITVGSSSNFTTKLSASGIKDWSGPDPDEVVQDVFDQTTEKGFTLSHSGKFNTKALLARSLKYDLSVSARVTDSYSVKLVRGGSPLFDARTEGTRETTMLPLEYHGCGGTIGKPVNAYAKVADSFNLNNRSGSFKNRFNIGAEYRLDGNVGTGFYNVNPLLPLSSSGYRPRDFRTIPFLNQAVAYAEDNFEVAPDGGKGYPRFKGQAGLRWTMIQPGREEQMQSLSPRLNLNVALSKWFSFRGGYGLSEKTPSQLMLYPDVSYLDYMNINCTMGDRWLGVYTTRIVDHKPLNLKPMRSAKVELGFDVNPGNGMTFSVIGFSDQVKNGFGSTNNEWRVMSFDRWRTSDIHQDEDGQLHYDPLSPSYVQSTLENVTRTANQDIHITRGVEYDFNFGKIKRTGTSFYLSGSWSETDYKSANDIYNRPKGSSDPYQKLYFIYPSSTRSNSTRRMTSALRVVQSIPALNFVLSGTLQAVLYDYTKSRQDIEAPTGYVAIGDDGRTEWGTFSEQDIANASSITVKGFSLADNIYSRSVYYDLPETWPTLWTFNLRVTKDVSEFLGMSFYVNNLFFSQPWQHSSISQMKVEKNANFFSFGFELFLNL